MLQALRKAPFCSHKNIYIYKRNRAEKGVGGETVRGCNRDAIGVWRNNCVRIHAVSKKKNNFEKVNWRLWHPYTSYKTPTQLQNKHFISGIASLNWNHTCTVTIYHYSGCLILNFKQWWTNVVTFNSLHSIYGWFEKTLGLHHLLG